jgi:O-antigen ligase
MGRYPERGRRRRTRRGGRAADRRALGLVLGLVLVVWLALSGGGFEPVDFGSVGFALWATIALLLLFGQIPDARPSPAMKKAMIAFACLVGWSALSLLWTESVERTAAELDRLAISGGVLLLAGWGLRRDSWRAPAIGLALAAVAIAGLAAIFRLLPEIAPAAARMPSIAEGRLAFPIEYWNGLAAVCAMAVCAGVAWGAQGGTPAVRAAALATIPVSGLSLYLTYSRGGVLALACGLVLVIALARERAVALRVAAIGLAATLLTALLAASQEEIAAGTGGSGGGLVLAGLIVLSLGCGWWGMARGVPATGEKKARKAPSRGSWIAAAALSAAVLVVAAIDGESSRAAPAEGNPAARLVSVGTDRSVLWSTALDAFAENPVLGVGAGNYGLRLSHEPDALDLAADAHSLPLETAAELGVVGLALLGALAAILGRGAWRVRSTLERSRDRTASAAMLSFALVFGIQSLVDWVWEVTAVSVLGLGALAVAAAAGNGRVRSRPSGWRRMLLVAGCTLLCALQVPGLVAAERTGLSERALAAGYSRIAARAAKDATTAAPWSARAYAQRAAVALSTGDDGVARHATEEAIALEPSNWEHWLLLARVAAAGENEAGARAALRVVAELRPAARQVVAGLSADPLSLAVPAAGDGP